MILWELFLAFLEIGLFSVGGGYAAIPLLQSTVVDGHAWLTLSEFSDLVTIAEMTPGPIGINAATFVGIRIAGVPGALIASLDAVNVEMPELPRRLEVKPPKANSASGNSSKKK